MRWSNGLSLKRLSATAVSYTHPDVYKRQEYGAINGANTATNTTRIIITSPATASLFFLRRCHISPIRDLFFTVFMPLFPLRQFVLYHLLSFSLTGCIGNEFWGQQMQTPNQLSVLQGCTVSQKTERVP